MSDKKIVVPEGMLKAAEKSMGWPHDDTRIKTALKAALLWQSENPIVPTDEQMREVLDTMFVGPENLLDPKDAVVDWQRRMYLAPKQVVPEEIKDLLVDGNDSLSSLHLIEAYRRGQNSKG